MMQLNTNRKVISFKVERRKKRFFENNNRNLGIAVFVAILIGLFLGFRPNAYQIIIQGKSVGAIKDKAILQEAKETVIAQLETRYGSKVQFEEEVMLKRYRAPKRDYIDPSYLVTYMRKNVNVLVGFWALNVDGEEVGIIANEQELEELKQKLKKEYYGNKDVEVAFAKSVELKEVFARESDLISKELLLQKCKTTTPKTVTYEIKTGDSLWLVADKLGVTTEELLRENPQIGEKMLVKVGDKIQAKVNEPFLPLIIIEKDTLQKEV